MMTIGNITSLQAVGVGFLFCTVTSVLLAQPTLRITSPTEGRVFKPGETVTVRVDASSAGAVKTILVFGAPPLGYCEPRDAPPYEFKIQIPTEIRPSQYLISAYGIITPGRFTSEDSVKIIVDPPSCQPTCVSSRAACVS